MPAPSPLPGTEPPHDCPRCSRLVQLRNGLRTTYPDWWNAPVPAFGDPAAWLAIVGLAPGRRGANRTGRPFTGDSAGDFLFSALARAGLSTGSYAARADDGLALNGTIILNAVKCLPPGNKPLPGELDACRDFLARQIDALPNLRVIIALGRLAHESLLKRFGIGLSDAKFAHRAEHRLPGGALLIDSYHCSRQTTNTGRLTPAMFDAVFDRAREERRPTGGSGA